MTFFKAMATISGLTLASRILGFVRDLVLASVLGAGIISDAFFVAMKLPNLFRRITAEGAFSVAFVPIYTHLKERGGLPEANQFAGRAMSGMILILLGFCVVAMAFMPQFVSLIAPGFETSGERFDLAVSFSRITFPFLMFASLAALMGGVLNAHNRFAPFAATSIILNASMLIALVALTPLVSNAGYAVSWGILIAGIVQIAFLYYCAQKAGIDLKPRKPAYDDSIKTLLNKMGPGIVSAGVVQLNLFVDMVLASMLATGSISYLYYADRLNQLPLGLVGVAIATALLPMLSSAIAQKDSEKADHLYSRAMEFALVLTVPASVALIILAHPIISSLFENGEFTSIDAGITAQVLQAYALGLVAFVISKVYTTAFFARQDTMTPVKIGVVSALLNIALCLVMMRFIGVVGIALATSISAWVQIMLLRRALKSRENLNGDARLIRHIPMIIGSALIMGVVLSVSFFIPTMIDGSEKLVQLLLLSGVIGLGVLIYGALVWRARIVTIEDFKKFLTKEPKQATKLL